MIINNNNKNTQTIKNNSLQYLVDNHSIIDNPIVILLKEAHAVQPWFHYNLTKQKRLKASLALPEIWFGVKA